MEYLGRVKRALSRHMGSINFVDPANIRKVHEERMSQVRTEATHISNKHKTQLKPIQFEWHKFLPTLEEDFPEILNEVLGQNNNQQQLLNSKET